MKKLYSYDTTYGEKPYELLIYQNGDLIEKYKFSSENKRKAFRLKNFPDMPKVPNGFHFVADFP